MKKRLAGCLCAVTLFLSSCAQPAPVPADSSEPPALSVDTGTPPHETGDTATVIVPTDAAGQTVTDSGGHAVTSIVAAPPTEIHTVTDAHGGAVTGTDGKPVTTIVYAATTTAASDNPVSAATRTATTTTRAATTTTRKPTTTARPTTTTTTAAPRPTGPWYAPYDLPAIYADCKREIERLGMVWKEELRPDSLGVSWIHPDNTVVYTYYPDEYSLKEYVMDELLPFYLNQPYTRRYCRIWMEPMEDCPGDFYLYFLEMF